MQHRVAILISRLAGVDITKPPVRPQLSLRRMLARRPLQSPSRSQGVKPALHALLPARSGGRRNASGVSYASSNHRELKF